MPWVNRGDISQYYQLIIRTKRCVEEYHFPTRADALKFLAKRRESKLDSRCEWVEKFDEQDWLDRLQQLIDQVIDESLVCKGYIKRKSVYISTRHIRSPLTKAEKSLVRKVKANAKPRYLADLEAFSESANCQLHKS